MKWRSNAAHAGVITTCADVVIKGRLEISHSITSKCRGRKKDDGISTSSRISRVVNGNRDPPLGRWKGWISRIPPSFIYINRNEKERNIPLFLSPFDVGRWMASFRQPGHFPIAKSKKRERERDRKGHQRRIRDSAHGTRTKKRVGGLILLFSHFKETIEGALEIILSA